MIGVQLDSGEIILTRDLLQEVCRLVPDSASEIQAAFANCTDRVRKATFSLPPGVK